MISEILLKLTNSDIVNFLSTSKLANQTIDIRIVHKLEWENKTRIPFDFSIDYKEQEEMYNEMGIKYSELINALGGLKKVYEFPVLKVDDDKKIKGLKVEELEFPVMRGKWKNRPFIAFCLSDNSVIDNYLENHLQVEVFIQDNFCVDVWHSTNHLINFFDRNFFSTKKFFYKSRANKKYFRLMEKAVLGRLNRLVNYQKIGYSKLMPIGDIDPDYPPYFPEQVRKSKGGNFYTSIYEVKPKPDEETSLALWNLSKTEDENFDIIEGIQ